MDFVELHRTFFEAFIQAINTIGFDNFKKCSFFGSNWKDQDHEER